MNAPEIFQWLMRKVLCGVTSCEAYLDDLVIYSNSWEDHVNRLDLVFSRLAEASLTLNLSKCEFVKAVITYLDKMVSQGQ